MNFYNRGYRLPVVGIPFADSGSTGKDAGKIFSFAGGMTLSQNSSNVEGIGRINENFGYSVNSGDFNGDNYDDLAIGVPNDTVGTRTNAGSVNVIYGSAIGLSTTAGRADQIWSQTTVNVEDSAESNDKFGFSVTTADFNNDGRDDLAIGVPFEDISGVQDAGAINLIYGSAAGLSATSKPDQFWSQNSSNMEDFSEKGDKFGSSLV